MSKPQCFRIRLISTDLIDLSVFIMDSSLDETDSEVVSTPEITIMQIQRRDVNTSKEEQPIWKLDAL